MSNNLTKIHGLSKQHQALSLVLQGYSREHICKELGVSEDHLAVIFSHITTELDSELDDLREHLLAVSMFRLEDLIRRNYTILDHMESNLVKRDSKDGKAADLPLSVRDYNTITRTIADLITKQVGLVTPTASGRPAKNGMIIDGIAKNAALAPSTIQETDDIYTALLNEIADDLEKQDQTVLSDTGAQA